MPDIPSWWEALLIALAAWRIWHLLAEDTILDKPRRWILRLDPAWEKEGDAAGARYREEWGLFLLCPYCAGFWISVLWWGAWLIWPHATTMIAVPFAINTVVVVLSKLDTEE